MASTSNFLASKDFEYDHKDYVILSTAFRELKDDDTVGYRLGLASVVGTHIGLEKITRWGSKTCFFLGFLTGVSVYNMWTHKSKSYYDHIAQKVNRKVSLELNSMIN